MSQFNPGAVHLLERDDLHILFCKDTLEFFEISKEDADNARSIIAQHREFIDPDDITDFKKSKVLNILQFDISEDCNLRCSYCVADGGRFGREPKLMSPETAIKGLEIVLNYYERINNIQFFGGEPLLNFKTIKAVIEYFYKIKDKDPEFTLPRFNINTNGTILNEEILSFIEKYPITFVVSIDGPEKIHNRFRKTRSGQDTFKQILHNVNIIYQKTGEPAGFEMVFGTHFLEEGWSLRKTIEYLESILPPNNHTLFAAPLLISEYASPEIKKYAGYHKDLIPTYIEMIRAGFNDIKRGKKPLFNSKVHNLIRNLMNKKPTKYFCAPAKTKLMLDADGNFIPCNAFVDKPDFIIGNIADPRSFLTNIEKFEDYFLSRRKTIYYKQCASCWSFNLCSFCMAHIFKGEKPYFDEIDENICHLNQAIAQEVVLQIGFLRRNIAYWQNFEKYLRGGEIT